jgi:hypothetical protein
MTEKDYFKLFEKKSESYAFRQKYQKKNIELVDITGMCTAEINSHGWCNSFNEPDENIYHIKIYYRKEIVAQVGKELEVVDDSRFVVFQDCDGFIIFLKVPRGKTNGKKVRRSTIRNAQKSRS